MNASFQILFDSTLYCVWGSDCIIKPIINNQVQWVNAERSRLTRWKISFHLVCDASRKKPVFITSGGEMKSVFHNPLNYLLNVLIRTLRCTYSWWTYTNNSLHCNCFICMQYPEVLLILITLVTWRHRWSIREFNTLQTGVILIWFWLLNVADRVHNIMILGHTMLQSTIHCSGAMFLRNIGPKYFA
jgi:hypothetical protein